MKSSVYLAVSALYSASITATKLMREDYYSNSQAVMERGRDENLEKGARYTSWPNHYQRSRVFSQDFAA